MNIFPVVSSSTTQRRSGLDKSQSWRALGSRMKCPSSTSTPSLSYGQSLLRMYADDCRKRQQMAVMMIRGQMPPLNDVLPSRTETLVSNLRFIFQQEVGKEQGDAKLAEFFKSGAVNEVPFNVIAAAMYASLALKAAAGHSEPGYIYGHQHSFQPSCPIAMRFSWTTSAGRSCTIFRGTTRCHSAAKCFRQTREQISFATLQR
jgi:hypothetical protein